MNYTILRLQKINLAPLTFIVLQSIMIASGILVSDYFTSFTLYTGLFWLDVFLAIIFYFITHLRDPGYITLADLQITDTFYPISFQNRNLEQRQKQSSSGFMRQSNQHNISDIKQRAKSEEENIELNVVNLPDQERLQNEPSAANSPKQIKSLNHSDEDVQQYRDSNRHSPLTPEPQLPCEDSEEQENNNQMTGSFADIEQSQKKHKRKQNNQAKEFTSPQQPTQTVGNSNSEGSTKDTHQPTNFHQPSNLNQSQSGRISAESIGIQSPTSQSGKIEIRLDEEHQVYIERRYCNQCNQDQLIRSKHCQKCGRCVACYDHHCPWMGNCIGERNKCPFYWFMMFQMIEITVVCLELYQGIDWTEQYFASHVYMLLVLLLLAFFVFMIGCLLIYHTYLAFINLTTWENVSWHKISYLKELPEQNGSPFSKGWMGNIRNFCRFRIPTITNWDYNLDTLRYMKH